MEIKGTAVKTTEQFMKDRYPDLYLDWKRELPAESRVFFRNLIHATKWYPLFEAVILPTEAVARVINKSKIDTARELGKYSAEVALSGVYKIFIRISNPDFVISRATQVFSTYYQPGSIEITERNDTSIKTAIKDFEKKDELIMHRIAGWMEGTLEATRRKTIHSEVIIADAENNRLFCEIIARWT
jgi:hypothetical protein